MVREARQKQSAASTIRDLLLATVRTMDTLVFDIETKTFTDPGGVDNFEALDFRRGNVFL